MDSNKKFNQLIDSLEDLKAKSKKVESELNIAYQYKEDVLGKIQFADKQISDKQYEFRKVLNDMKTEVCGLKIFIDTEYIK